VSNCTMWGAKGLFDLREELSGIAKALTDKGGNGVLGLTQTRAQENTMEKRGRKYSGKRSAMEEIRKTRHSPKEGVHGDGLKELKEDRESEV